MKISAFIGYDNRWPIAYAVAVKSLMDMAGESVLTIEPILLPHLQALGLYNRETTMHGNQMWDVVSDAPMSTEFAISRFFIPILAGYKGWSLFTDSDFLFRCNIAELVRKIDPAKAVMCVKHQYDPGDSQKMDGQMQTRYSKKNWSSLMLINNAHPKNQALTLEYLNTTPGRDLHAFSWLHEDDIGALPPEFNWLEGHSDEALDAKIVHFTRGSPDMAGYENVKYADEWRALAGTINLTRNL